MSTSIFLNINFVEFPKITNNIVNAIYITEPTAAIPAIGNVIGKNNKPIVHNKFKITATNNIIRIANINVVFVKDVTVINKVTTKLYMILNIPFIFPKKEPILLNTIITGYNTLFNLSINILDNEKNTNL